MLEKTSLVFNNFICFPKFKRGQNASKNTNFGVPNMYECVRNHTYLVHTLAKLMTGQRPPFTRQETKQKLKT